jgi:hypothetical protein
MNQHFQEAAADLAANPGQYEIEKSKALATLALAYEQRTANLIALYSMDESARQGMVDGAGMHSGNWVDVTKQIKERLDLL